MRNEKDGTFSIYNVFFWQNHKIHIFKDSKFKEEYK